MFDATVFLDVSTTSASEPKSTGGIINDVIYQAVRGQDTHTYTLYELSNGDVKNIAKLICLFIDFVTLDCHYNHNGRQIHYKPKPTVA